MEENQVACRRCGFVWAVAADKRGRKDLLCISCRAKPQKTIQYGNLRCTPHLGDLDAKLRPIDENGKLYLPGERSCKHTDCVNPKHVVPNN